MNSFCIINIFASVFVCIVADVIGFLTLSWGNQLYITIIETAFLELLMLIFLLIEYFTTRKLKDNEYAKVEIEISFDRNNADRDLANYSIIRFTETMNKSKRLNNQLENSINEEDKMIRRNSLPSKGNEREDTPEHPRSYPLSPKTRKELENLVNNPLNLSYGDEEDFWKPEDSIYAKNKPLNPLGRLRKAYEEEKIQTLTTDHKLIGEQDFDDKRVRNRNKVR